MKKFTHAEMDKGIIRGATPWKRVQIHAAGMTQKSKTGVAGCRVALQEGKNV